MTTEERIIEEEEEDGMMESSSSSSSAATVRICGISWTPCGYCKGTRSYLSSKRYNNNNTSSTTTTTTTTTDESVNETTSSNETNELNEKDTTSTSHNQNNSSCSYAMSAKYMTFILYEQLINDGWRRSGNTLYLPINNISCCPTYPIRLHAFKFIVSSSQRKLIKRFQQLLTQSSLLSLSDDINTASATNDTNGNHYTTSAINHELKQVTTTPSKRYMKRKLNHHQPPTSSSTNNNTTSQQYIIPKNEITKNHIQQQQQYNYDINNHNIIQSSTIIKELCHHTETVIQQVIFNCTSDHSLPWIQKVRQHRPIQYKIKSISKKNILPSQQQLQNKQYSHNSNIITVTSSICAEIAGKSMGNIQRHDFVQQVVTLLQEIYNTKQQDAAIQINQKFSNQPLTMNNNSCNNNNNDGNQSSSEQTISIISIDSHNESGQILVQLHVNPSCDTNTEKMADCSSNAIIDDDVHTNGCSGLSIKRRIGESPVILQSKDRIMEWWESIQQDHGTEYYYNVPQPQKPYEITITTIPAHTSALDPRVHQLYFLYQHKVHNESYPLKSFCNQSKDNTKFVDAGCTTVSDHTNTFTTLEDDPALTDHENNSHNTIKGMNIITSDIDWGRQNSPNGWYESVIQMLQNEYGSHPSFLNHQQQQTLLDAYGTFYEFLVENPFHNSNIESQTTTSNNSTSSSSSTLPMGTYHQHYTLSGNILIAVGVIDILPNGLSSVYLFYHPSFAKDIVPIGKYAIIKEIEYTQQLHLQYYYLGYYIHSCTKMNYKSNFYPSEILCPITKQWVDVTYAKQIIDQNSPNHHYCTLSIPNNNNVNDDNDNDTNASTTLSATDSSKATTISLSQEQSLLYNYNIEELDRIKLYVGHDKPLSFSMLSASGQNLIRPILHEFIRHVGGYNQAKQYSIDLCS